MGLFLATFCFGRVTNAELIAATLRRKKYQHFRMSRESWLIRTSQSASSLCNVLDAVSQKGDEILVTQVVQPFGCRLGESALAWLAHNLEGEQA